MTEFAENVRATVKNVPHGQIVSYGAIAAMAGNPRAARGVGFVLSHTPEGSEIPWWRVVNRQGLISTSRDTGTAQIQRALLEEEGVEFNTEGQISWERFGWDPYPDTDDHED